jgi:hypothetical protein
MLINWRDQKIFIFNWEPNAPNTCELCHYPRDDLRPYGPCGAWICLDCGNIDRFRTECAMSKALEPADFCVRPPDGSSRWSEDQMLRMLDDILIAKGDPT